MKVKKLIELLSKYPSDYDVCIPPEDYVNIKIYKDDTFEQVCIEYQPMNKRDLLNEIRNG